MYFWYNKINKKNNEYHKGVTMAALHITKDNFDKEVINSQTPVLLDFWAEWCAPCRMLLPLIEELSVEATGAKICKINVDEQPELAMQFKIMTIPTLVVMENGKVSSTSIGVRPKSAILDMLKS